MHVKRCPARRLYCQNLCILHKSGKFNRIRYSLSFGKEGISGHACLLTDELTELDHIKRASFLRFPDPKPHGQFAPTFDNGISLPLEGGWSICLLADRSDEV